MPPPFWDEALYAARRPALLSRARLKSAMRAWFDGEGFFEVETNLVQPSPGNETHLHAASVTWMAQDALHRSGYLHTSPEFAMKKLIAAGETRIYQFAPVFRAREESRLHAPEFTMLEWYRAGADYTVLMADCAAFLALAADTTGRREWHFRGSTCDATAAPERISVSEAFSRHAGIALERVLEDEARFAAAVESIGLRIAPDDTWGDLFSRVVSEKIEPNLGLGRPTLLDRYPICEAALARPCPDDARFAERFELYLCGVELANAFGELTDAQEQRARFEADMAEKLRLYGEIYPLDEDFLAALAVMPPASGIALGFDRLAMLACGVESVEAIRFTP